MAPDELENGAQCCFDNFDCRLFIGLSNFLNWILLVSFTPTGLKKSSTALSNPNDFMSQKLFHYLNQGRTLNDILMRTAQ